MDAIAVETDAVESDAVEAGAAEAGAAEADAAEAGAAEADAAGAGAAEAGVAEAGAVESDAAAHGPSGHAPAAGGRSLSGEKAQRIVEAMRRSVAQRGTAASTFDHVSRAAGVSRGLLHYYFGTKEQLLVEAVRRDCELRMEVLERQVGGAQTADDFIALMAQNLQETVREDPDFVTLVFELFTLSRRNTDIAAEYVELLRRTRKQLTGMLATAQREGVLRLHAEPEAVAEILFSLGDGFALRMLAEPDRDFTATLEAGILCVRALLAD
ncbi:MAG TPA: TetR/AcrR family transcriptional regulator [Solirubrobacteraceae bacterium]